VGGWIAGLIVIAVFQAWYALRLRLQIQSMQQSHVRSAAHLEYCIRVLKDKILEVERMAEKPHRNPGESRWML